jgi:starch synthase
MNLLSMHVLLAASELHPFSKTGGLADAVAALGQAAAHAGCRVTVVTPLYRGIAAKHPGIRRTAWKFDLPLGKDLVSGEFWQLDPAPGLSIWFVNQPGFFDRPGLYNEGQRDYPDNAQRFLFLTKAAMLAARYHPEPPAIIHGHDWQVGLLPLLVHFARVTGNWPAAPRTVFTIHNLAYQGVFPVEAWQYTNLPWSWFHLESAAHHGYLNFLKGALYLADALTTVSPRYAAEICTPEYGCGLEGILRRREHDLTGILNGVDYQEWNTQANPALPFAFDAQHPAGKAADKEALQAEMGLPVDASVPLFGNISRLTDQKGCDLILAALEKMLPATRLQFALLGSGDPELQQSFRSLASRYPENVAVRIGFDSRLAHRIEAACDFYLMPSRFEPCGLNQMYSLRYGAIPIVRCTGGLADSVTDPRDDPDRANGIHFHEPTAEALGWAMRKALAVYQDPEALHHLRLNGMTADFSWDKQAKEYLRLYGDVLHGP